jgi:hypothetical protein
MSVLKLPFLVGLQEKVGELGVSLSSCPSVIILENVLNYCIEKYDYGKFKYQYNVSTIHLHALLSVWNFRKVVRVCADPSGHAV